ncbi:CLUMA_CG013878, isoform A [Clunio marinus]|uniref:CLUMA_CG013878, isoform A n=1 Tax=Clunio marinus TaxID=568069 RepID=A0A1J1ILI4_9DIPT|nr:CLUMA_CG013878, isoform A [Clunio marinus]
MKVLFSLIFIFIATQIKLNQAVSSCPDCNGSDSWTSQSCSCEASKFKIYSESFRSFCCGSFCPACPNFTLTQSCECEADDLTRINSPKIGGVTEINFFLCMEKSL